MRKFILLISMLFSIALSAQEADIAMIPDTNVARIGEQIHVNFLVVALADERIDWPVFQDHLENLEVVEQSAVDTQNREALNQYKIEFSITAWDSGYYLFGPFPIVADGDTVWSDALYITYQTIGDIGEEIADIRPPVDMPLTFKEWMQRYGWWILLGIIVLVLAYFLFKKLKKSPEEIEESIPLIPPYEEAMSSLKELREKELWQKGEIKNYYAELTSVFRKYLERSWQIDALEITAAELDSEMNRRFPQLWLQHEMKSLQSQADLAKFAKARFVAEDHVLNMERCTAFLKSMEDIKIREAQRKEVEE